MAKKQGKADVRELYTLMEEHRQTRLDLEKQAKEAKKLEESFRDALMAEIDPGEERSGIYHNIERRASVSWTDYSKAIIELLPKTKREHAQALKDDYTNYTERHVFKDKQA